MRRLPVLTVAAAVLAAASWLVLRDSGGAESAVQPETARSPDKIHVNSLSVKHPIPALVAVTPVVAVGEITAIEERRLADVPGVSEEAKRQNGEDYEFGEYLDHTFEVEEFLRGSGDPTLSVRTRPPPSPGDRVQIFSDVEYNLAAGPYVLFLFPVPHGDIFTGGYQIGGEQGVGVVGADGTVTLGFGEKTTVDELRSIAAKAPSREEYLAAEKRRADRFRATE